MAVFENSQQHLTASLATTDLRIRWAVARARAGGLDASDEFRGLYISDNHIDQLLGYEYGQHLWMRSRNGENAHAGSKAYWEEWAGALTRARNELQAKTEASLKVGTRLLLDELVQAFGLANDELEILLIALAPEFDPRYERFFAYLQDDVTRKRPSIDLVLNLITDSFAQKLQLRKLFTQDGRLLRFHLVHIFSDNSNREPSLLAQNIRPASNVVEHLLGHSSLSSQLNGFAYLQAKSRYTSPRRISIEFAEQLAESNKVYAGQYPLFAFRGPYGVGKKETAEYLASAANRPLLTVDLAGLKEFEEGFDYGLSLVLRDGRLLRALLYLVNWDAILQDGHPPSQVLRRLLHYPHTIVVAGELAWRPIGELRSDSAQQVADGRHDVPNRRPIFFIDFRFGKYDQRLSMWQAHVHEPQLDLRQISNHFRFTPGQIEDALATARDLALQNRKPLTLDDLFAASRAHSNQKLATLATKIKPRYHWADIVLPIDTMEQLREMVNTVQQRSIVYERWGFETKLALGKGLNVLFAGESGTGKTMAADIMANVLNLDLYKIDLSRLVSKYIGETEKNLNKIFTEAKTSNAILFFDEADAIFGKRSEVRDSHDRHANVEVSYLLQRMESYDGIVILATNLRANLDEAFTRRMHFITEFPFPEAEDRRRIWQVNFPPDSPLAPDVDFGLLAERFRLSGGNIRNIILAAAFLAANSEEKVIGMAHLLHAARREYQKMGRLLDENMFEQSQGAHRS